MTFFTVKMVFNTVQWDHWYSITVICSVRLQKPLSQIYMDLNALLIFLVKTLKLQYVHDNPVQVGWPMDQGANCRLSGLKILSV